MFASVIALLTSSKLICLNAKYRHSVAMQNDKIFFKDLVYLFEIPN